MEAQEACDEQARHVDVLSFTQFDTDRAVQPVELHADEIDADRPVQPAESQADTENLNKDEENIFD